MSDINLKRRYLSEGKPQRGYLCKVQNYSQNLCLVYMGLEKLSEDKVLKVNDTKNFGYKHHYLKNEGIFFKVLSQRDDHSMMFNASNKRFVTVCNDRYYYTIWKYINGEWKVFRLNIEAKLRCDINILEF